MKSQRSFNSPRLISFVLSIVFLISVFILALTGCTKPPAPDKPPAPTNSEFWNGFYTDATSYKPGDSIQIYGSAPNVDMIFRLVKMDTDWSEIARTNPITVGPQSSLVGSFIEYPSVSLAGRTSFTLEGWLHPTLLGGDTVVVAGQFGATESAAGIIITPGGRLGAYVSDTPQTDQARLAIAPVPDNFEKWLDTWHHLALTYDGAQVILYIDGRLAAQRAQSGPVAQVTTPFRVGARAEAPGDLTGIIDGRLDSWALWPTALSAVEVEERRQRGLNEDDPSPNPDEIDLYIGFEGSYPTVNDSSSNGHFGVVTNHGNPSVAGVYGEGRAFRLNHDQIVDAGWKPTGELTIPSDTESGMYAVQALLGPDFVPTQKGDRLSVRAFAIRPTAKGQRAPIAVVLPTNTWTVYNSWPGRYGPGITPRSRYPGGDTSIGGRNSTYGQLGDGISRTYFHGLLRPSWEYSPMKPSYNNINTADFSMRAPNSMYLMQWLDEQSIAYDVYSDDDFNAGLILASDYRVLMPHSHHEYWSDGMLESLTNFLDSGGSVVAPAGNIFTWRTVYGDNGVVETRQISKSPILGLADLQSGIDGGFMGLLKFSAACNGGGNYHGSDSFRALGVQIHYTHPCDLQQDAMFGGPLCLGKWVAQNSGHWLWQGSGLSDGEQFGFGRHSDLGPTFAVGHEADTWVEGMPLPGLAEGRQPVILAEGKGFKNYPKRVNNLLANIGKSGPTCDDIINKALSGNQQPEEELKEGSNTPQKAGTILYFPHSSGGHVLVIGASATPWALESDEALSGLLRRALLCFAYDEGCG